ncbi:transcriptional regulator, TetR family [Shewanella psychrophila]|uniref:Transcriptional regulator, TetR family n=1 Tax=Shewanella psychrophila TaxID=225848 RepID=A0A1S6HT43_9GAMM|nr:TetR family transcriptional regulator [Shewanella psychrophila]AQS38671.1 transcriptional regulator, TetR family [Shewanella psychrophila]
MTHPLTYVGRQTSRSDGEARRLVILEATLRLIVREGIRGVRHRAVAKEADVPLASTTYYFKDIKDLISDSLTYFAEKTLWMNKELETRSFELLKQLSNVSLGAGEDTYNVSEYTELLVSNLTQFICAHIREQVFNRDDRILEVAFHEEALRNKQLASAINRLDESLLSTIQGFFDQLGSSSSLADAYQVLGLIKLLEYQSIVRNDNGESGPEFEIIISSAIRNIIKGILS